MGGVLIGVGYFVFVLGIYNYLAGIRPRELRNIPENCSENYRQRRLKEADEYDEWINKYGLGIMFFLMISYPIVLSIFGIIK